jgi:hypothetical protein
MIDAQSGIAAKKTGTLLGRQGADFLEDSAGASRNALKLWWVQQDSNLRPAD